MLIPQILLLGALVHVQTAVQYTHPGSSAFTENQNFRSVGVYGTYGNGTKLQERAELGGLTCTVKMDRPDCSVVWPNFYGRKDMVLGKAVLPGTAGKPHERFVDWTTAAIESTNVDGEHNYSNEIFVSRAFPAVLYRTNSPCWTWSFEDVKFDALQYLTEAGNLKLARVGDKIGALGAPWVLLWNLHDGVEKIPLLIRFQHKPTSLTLGKNLAAQFKATAGSIAVMPLHGIKRERRERPRNDTAEAGFWSRALAAFPAGTDESFTMAADASHVNITDRFRYLELRDDWGTKPLFLAPVSPVTAVAEANGYPVKWDRPVLRSQLATFLGPYAYAKGKQVSYVLPTPSALQVGLAPLRVQATTSKLVFQSELDSFAKAFEIKPDDDSDGGFNLQLKELSQGFRLFSQPIQAALKPKMAKALDTSYSPANLVTVTEPLTGQRYVMCNKIWCANEPYDREWYAGRQLDFTSEYTAWVDPAASSPHWKDVQGLYAYYRIYSDWAWSGVSSSVFGYALCGDGMNFAMEGMLGVAKMARRTGDQELYRDAAYRTAKQAVCTYASFFLSKWVKDVDYATWTDTSYDYKLKHGRYISKRMAPEKVETRFGLDIYSDTSGIKVLRPGSYWHSVAGVFWNNPSLYRLYSERLYRPVYDWIFKTMPALHPGWNNRNVTEVYENHPYGNNHALAIIDARAVLFGDHAETLKKLARNLQAQITPLYVLRQKQDLLQAGLPQVWLPTGQAELIDSAWNGKNQTLTVTMKTVKVGNAHIDWTWRSNHGPSPEASTGPKPRAANLNGRPVRYRKILGGFWSSNLRLKPGAKIVFQLQY